MTAGLPRALRGPRGRALPTHHGPAPRTATPVVWSPPPSSPACHARSPAPAVPLCQALAHRPASSENGRRSSDERREIAHPPPRIRPVYPIDGGPRSCVVRSRSAADRPIAGETARPVERAAAAARPREDEVRGDRAGCRAVPAFLR